MKSNDLLIHTIVVSIFLAFSLILIYPLQIALSSPDRLGYITWEFLATLLFFSTIGAICLITPKIFLGRNYFNFVLSIAVVIFLYGGLIQIDYGLFRGNRFGDENKIHTLGNDIRVLEWVGLTILIFLLCKTPRKIIRIFSIFFTIVFLGSLVDVSMKLFSYMSEDEIAEAQTNPSSNVEIEPIFSFSKTHKNIVFFIKSTRTIR